MTGALSGLLRDHPAGLHEPLVHASDRAYSKGDLSAAVDDLAKRLPVAAAGAPVLVVAGGVDALVAMFAVWSVDGVVIPVNPRSPDTVIADVRDTSDAAAMIRDGAVTEYPSDTRHPPGTALVLWTSGTTGPPTPIVHEHDSYLEIIDRVLAPLGKGRDPTRRPSPNLIPVSMALNAGIYNALFGLRAGAPLVIMERFDPEEFAELVALHEVRSTVLPPAAIVMLNDDDRVSDLQPLRYVRSITAPLSAFQARRFTESFGVFVLNGYGQTELGEVIGWTAADARANPDRIGAVGRPHPGVAVRIDGPDEQGVGELLVRPPEPPGAGVRAALGDRLAADGFVRTGDMARIDDAEFVWIEGRVSDLINRGGNKVHPVEVEEVLATVPGVEDVAVVGRADYRLGEVPVAFVVGAASDDELFDACRRHLVPYKIPARIERIAAIPRNEIGKIERMRLP